MKKCWFVLVLCVLFVFSGCKSDDVMSKDAYGLRVLLNNEWESIEAANGIFELVKLEYPITEKKINSLFELKTVPLKYVYEKISLGMNKKGGFYTFSEKLYPSNYEFQPGSVIYFCLTQKENRFSGKFNEVPVFGEPFAYEGEMHIRKIDEKTIKVLIVKHQVDDNRRFMDYDLYVLNKKGGWKEETSVKSLLEDFNADAQFIELIGGEHFERDVAQGRCK
ncbi:hypothetical protein [Myroides odoratus]|uniref:hypothetical protein n=1 Tax=Myroides odoratus TaxID=256 RepID=UPI003342822B